LYLYPGTLPGIERPTVGQYDQYLISLQEATRISVTSLLNPDTTSAEIEAITEQYLHHDEDIPDRHAEPSIISMSRHVSECINAGLTYSTGIANDLESTDEGNMVSIPIPILQLLHFCKTLHFTFNQFQFPHFQLYLRLIFLIL